MEKNRKTVRIYTDSLNGCGYGDFVSCTDCGELQLTRFGKSHCMRCGSENLAWADPAREEYSITGLEESGYGLMLV